MIDENPDALKYVNFGIFQDEIFEIGGEFCKYISKFPTLSYQLLLIKDKSPELLKAISSKINTYENSQDNLDEIEVLITYSARNIFELKDKSINIDELTECAYKNSNEFQLINVPYGDNYEERLQDELQRRYNNAKDTKEKLNIYLNKVYGLSTAKAKALLKDFGLDLDNLTDIPKETKGLFKELEEIIDVDDEKEIDTLFQTQNIKYKTTDIKRIQTDISRECAKEFSSEFMNTDKRLKERLQEDFTEIEYNGNKIKQIKLNGKFNILLHSTDTQFINTKDEVENFKDDWNKGKDKKNHIISTTYVNQDFLGTAPVGENGVRYAFSTLKSEDIRLMGVTDLNIYSNYFAYDSAKRQYMSANTLAYNSRRVYSEFGIEREGITPDYLVVMDDDCKEVIENSHKAAVQFGIPILYVDKKEIEQVQIENIQNLLEEFKNTNDKNVLQTLINTYETNVAGWLLNRSEEKDESFTAGINNIRFKEDFDTVQKEITKTVKEYLLVERNSSEKDICDVIGIMLNEIELYKECEETKPVSKTKISFNAKELLEYANDSLENIGRQDLKVNLENIPTSKEYEIRINQIARNALEDENLITIEDFESAKHFLENKDRTIEKSVRDNEVI